MYAGGTIGSLIIDRFTNDCTRQVNSSQMTLMMFDSKQNKELL